VFVVKGTGAIVASVPFVFYDLMGETHPCEDEPRGMR